MSFFIAYHPSYVHDVPEGHRFPMEKYKLLYEQLHYEGILEDAHLISPECIDLSHVYAVHEKSYVDKLLSLACSPKEQRASGFEHTPQLIARELRIMEGTRKCAEAVIHGGVALNIAGGTHHAYTDRGEGFCLLNDLAIAAQWLLNHQHAKKVLIIDLDVHQGNGTAEIFRNSTSVFTFSMHGRDNYPLRKETSHLDIALPSNTTDSLYLSQLNECLADIFHSFEPDFVLYQCGVDVLSSDKLGHLSLSQNGVKLRDQCVFRWVQERNLPLVCSMGGGYSEHIRDIVNAHMWVFRLGSQYSFKNSW